MRAQHTAVGATKTLECQQCNRSFTRPENLARHAKTHDAVHPHRCQTVGSNFLGVTCGGSMSGCTSDPLLRERRRLGLILSPSPQLPPRPAVQSDRLSFQMIVAWLI